MITKYFKNAKARVAGAMMGLAAIVNNSSCDVQSLNSTILPTGVGYNTLVTGYTVAPGVNVSLTNLTIAGFPTPLMVPGFSKDFSDSLGWPTDRTNPHDRQAPLFRLISERPANDVYFATSQNVRDGLEMVDFEVADNNTLNISTEIYESNSHGTFARDPKLRVEIVGGYDDVDSMGTHIVRRKIRFSPRNPADVGAPTTDLEGRRFFAVGWTDGNTKGAYVGELNVLALPPAQNDGNGGNDGDGNNDGNHDGNHDGDGMAPPNIRPFLENSYVTINDAPRGHLNSPINNRENIAYFLVDKRLRPHLSGPITGRVDAVGYNGVNPADCFRIVNQSQQPYFVGENGAHDVYALDFTADKEIGCGQQEELANAKFWLRLRPGTGFEEVFYADSERMQLN